MFYAQSTAKGHNQGNIKCKVKFWFVDLKVKHIPLLKIWRKLEKMKLNEPGGQKLGGPQKPWVAEVFFPLDSFGA